MHKRATLAIALAVLPAAFAPASAGAATSPEVGRDKVAERVAAECRRAGVVDDATCWSGIGRRVIRSEVADYEKTWVHRANEFQYRLGAGVPFKDAPWLGTHNSANSTAELPSASQTDSNQQLTLPEQLRLDVRSLEIDIHWVPSVHAGGAPAAVACHARPKGEMHAGCTTERLMGERLREVDAWLEAHPNEVILLYLEDAIEDPAGYQSAGAEVAEIFKGQLFTGEAGCQKLPLSLTRDAVRAAGKQVVIVSDCGSGAWAGNVFSWKSDVSDESGGPDIRPDGCPAMDYLNRLTRVFEDSTWVSATVSGGTGGWITPDNLRTMMRCGIDLFGLDQLLPFDGRLQAAVWTWASETAVPRAGECAAQRPDGRWEGVSCESKRRPACVSAARAWTVPATAVKRKSAAAACADAGLELGTPRTSEENAALRTAAGASSVWLAYSPPASKTKTRRR